VALVFGEEAHGMSPEAKAICDMLVKIPIRGKAESLNVAASCAVALFEALRQRG
jgi:TrmH family RNA methyltransferase